ncbi:hypothetical protein BASA61_002709 [Batrachochytrium salamandrivorans]|nr:hypothetical protein BASA61_002709 [Batrachochytrium salamandrivorans]
MLHTDCPVHASARVPGSASASASDNTNREFRAILQPPASYLPTELYEPPYTLIMHATYELSPTGHIPSGISNAHRIRHGFSSSVQPVYHSTSMFMAFVMLLAEYSLASVISLTKQVVYPTPRRHSSRFQNPQHHFALDSETGTSIAVDSIYIENSSWHGSAIHHANSTSAIIATPGTTAMEEENHKLELYLARLKADFD